VKCNKRFHPLNLIEAIAVRLKVVSWSIAEEAEARVDTCKSPSGALCLPHATGDARPAPSRWDVV
jgi:hypothetical protein